MFFLIRKSFEVDLVVGGVKFKVTAVGVDYFESFLVQLLEETFASSLDDGLGFDASEGELSLFLLEILFLCHYLVWPQIRFQIERIRLYRLK